MSFGETTTLIGDWAVPRSPAPRLVINGEDQRTPLVTIHPSGEIEYGPGYSPDEAAQRFWDAMSRYFPGRCPSCGHIGLEAVRTPDGGDGHAHERQ